MNLERQLKCAISGSFDKYKAEIDKAIDDFTDLGVNVLAPEKGWLILPIFKRSLNFRALPSEIKMSIKQIEDKFLRAIAASDFHYVISPDGYVGGATAFEIGFALHREIPIFTDHSLSELVIDEGMLLNVSSEIPVLTPEQVVLEMKQRLF